MGPPATMNVIKSVSMIPGCTAFTRMLCSPNSSAAHFTSISMAALLAQ